MFGCGWSSVILCPRCVRILILSSAVADVPVAIPVPGSRRVIPGGPPNTVTMPGPPCPARRLGCPFLGGLFLLVVILLVILLTHSRRLLDVFLILLDSRQTGCLACVTLLTILFKPSRAPKTFKGPCGPVCACFSAVLSPQCGDVALEGCAHEVAIPHAYRSQASRWSQTSSHFPQCPLQFH